MVEDSEGYGYDGSDYGGSEGGMEGYDYDEPISSSPVAHLRKVSDCAASKKAIDHAPC